MTDAQLDVLEARQAVFEHDLSGVKARVTSLLSDWDGASHAYEDARREYTRARADYEEAAHAGDAASEDFAVAEERWDEAEKNWQRFQKLVETAAMLDARRLDNFGGAVSGAGKFSCDAVSTSAFRRVLGADGVPLVGMDIDHIVPRSLGGADHPLNYQVLPSSVNRSLGAAWNIEKCWAAGVDKCAMAIAVSAMCGGYAGPWS